MGSKVYSCCCYYFRKATLSLNYEIMIFSVMMQQAGSFSAMIDVAFRVMIVASGFLSIR